MTKHSHSIPADAALFRNEILRFFESLRVADSAGGYGRYRYAACQTRPILYASIYSALARHLLNELQSFDVNRKKEWITYIQSFQDDDGFFKDAIIAHPDSWYVPPHMEWCGWWHLSCHAIMAMTALEGVVGKEFKIIQPFYDETYLHDWLNRRDQEKFDFVGNEILNLGQLLQYARDFHHIRPAGRAMEIVFEWLDKTQDANTGLWGLKFDTPEDMNKAYQGAYHFYLLYEYDRRPVAYIERIIDSMLSMQTALGGFGIFPDRTNTSGCEDIDAIDPLCRYYFKTKYRREDICQALNRAFAWVLRNRVADKGFVFIKDAEMFYGSKYMFSGPQEGSSFATWWRMLCLAIIAQVQKEHPLANYPWQFLECPGYQCWR
ncbi:MAG: hypothetical protein NT011_08705 [Kiritimatiellaeota bacterium]|nr:hypothetical protein [Kiritimatiellota bacterium]